MRGLTTIFFFFEQIERIVNLKIGQMKLSGLWSKKKQQQQKQQPNKQSQRDLWDTIKCSLIKREQYKECTKWLKIKG